MRVAVVVSGTRGDVQPMLAVALGLEAAGHEAIVCASPDNGDWARGLGCSFEALGDSMRGNPALGDWGARRFNRFIRRQIALQVRDLPRIVARCDVIVASGFAWGVHAVAERLRVRYRYLSFTPAGLLGTSRDPLPLRVVRAAAQVYAELAYGPALNRSRARLGLRPTRRVMVQMIGASAIAATDPELTVLPAGAHLRVPQTGYPQLDEPRELSARVAQFLDAGAPPVYAGFGSMPYGNAGDVARLLIKSAERAGVRLIVSRGWAALPDADAGPGCLFVDDEPHRLLFARVAAVVHHGGAGTVATAARAGAVQIILPQAADQFLWRGQVRALGLGPGAPMLRRASVGALASAMRAALDDPAYRRRAATVAARLGVAGDGTAATVAEIVRAGAAEREGDPPARTPVD